MLFKKLPLRIAADDIKIPKASRLNLTGFRGRMNHPFTVPLGLPIGMDWEFGVVLLNRDFLRNPIDRTARRKNELSDTHPFHGEQQRGSSLDIVGRIKVWAAHTFFDQGLRGEMHDSVHPMLFKDAGQTIGLQKVSDDQVRFQREFFVAGREVVPHDRVMALACCSLCEMAPDVSGTAGHKKFHETNNKQGLGEGPAERAELPNTLDLE